MDDGVSAASFRDPSGFVFSRDGEIYRQVNACYRAPYERLFASGLYDSLTASQLLVAHEEVDVPFPAPDAAYKVIKPQRIPFIAYPYEWCFGQLKAAALATLDIQSKALDCGMTLKDASAYNIQFRGARPVLIDSLSFDIYREGEPWIAYRQFCQHFLAPLALMAQRDVRLGQLLRIHIDGIPLDLAGALLPWRSRFQLGLGMHIHLHAKSQLRHADDARTSEAPPNLAKQRLGPQGLRGIIESLRATVAKLEWRPAKTAWSGYYGDTNYSADAMDAKQQAVSEFVSKLRPSTVWDLGGNTGVFSRIAAAQGASVICMDADAAAVEKNYRDCVAEKRADLLPLVIDLVNPSPSMGWDNAERDSLIARGPADLVLALALIHHLAIGNNVPLRKAAAFFAKAGRSLIIEFVPKSDSQVRRLLASREDIFNDYDRPNFEREFSAQFSIEESRAIAGSERVLYLMKRR